VAVIKAKDFIWEKELVLFSWAQFNRESFKEENLPQVSKIQRKV
jgi:hypothetical protein